MIEVDIVRAEETRQQHQSHVNRDRDVYSIMGSSSSSSSVVVNRGEPTRQAEGGSAGTSDVIRITYSSARARSPSSSLGKMTCSLI